MAAKTRLLLVEGKDDKHVCWSLMEHYQVPETFQIEDKEGIANLLEVLPVQLLGSGLERLGIVVDADTDIKARWAALRKILRDAGYRHIPTKPHPDGTIIEQPDMPKVGIWLMPNNSVSGMLEDFVSFLVPSGDDLWDHAAGCLDEIGERCRYPAVHRSKAHIHTWLAWQEEPGKPLGLAITTRYLDADAPHAQNFIVWVRRLFSA